MKGFYRQRYAKCDDSVGSATLILHKSKQNISTLLSVSRKNVADDGGYRNIYHRSEDNLIENNFVFSEGKSQYYAGKHEASIKEHIGKLFF